MMKVAASILIILFLGSCYLIWLDDKNWRDIIPIEFDLGSTLHSNSDLQGIREACGVHIYELEETTLDKIKAEVLEFLNTAKQARGHSRFYYSYGEWMHTPRKDWTRPENWAYELMCVKMPAKLQGIIIDSATAPGSFYSHGQEKVLMIILDQKILVLTHNG
ncbi:hypothetical protein ACJJH9_19295 [Microbulbifer sp. DLAB2-AF]|uniref:hypothetical protein n=1 Tax=Microbulbifer sp. DLAB2-AF TaxID=3243395 RepID=UPI0040399876